jgi:propanediol utilization protein
MSFLFTRHKPLGADASHSGVMSPIRIALGDIPAVPGLARLASRPRFAWKSAFLLPRKHLELSLGVINNRPMAVRFFRAA